MNTFAYLYAVAGVPSSIIVSLVVHKIARDVDGVGVSWAHLGVILACTLPVAALLTWGVLWLWRRNP